MSKSSWCLIALMILSSGLGLLLGVQLRRLMEGDD